MLTGKWFTCNNVMSKFSVHSTVTRIVTRHVVQCSIVEKSIICYLDSSALETTCNLSKCGGSSCFLTSFIQPHYQLLPGWKSVHASTNSLPDRPAMKLRADLPVSCRSSIIQCPPGKKTNAKEQSHRSIYKYHFKTKQLSVQIIALDSYTCSNSLWAPAGNLANVFNHMTTSSGSCSCHRTHTDKRTSYAVYRPWDSVRVAYLAWNIQT